MKKWFSRFLSLFMCLLWCAPCALAEEVPQLLEPAGVQLNAAAAFMGDISDITTYPAAVVPYVEEFFFEQEGVIEEMHVILGQEVKAGDPLITLDTEAETERMETLRRQLEELETNTAYEQELAGIDLAILDAEWRQLQKQGDETAIALKQLDIEEKKLELALAADLRALEKEQLISELERLETEIKKNVLCAPFDGRVAYMSNEWRHGDYVSAFTPLIYLADDTQLLVESDYISNTTLGSAHAVYAHIGSKRYAMTATPLDEKKNMAQVLSGVKLVRQFTFDEPSEELEAGQYAVICVESSYRSNVLLVPTNTLYTADRTRYLYVMEDGVRVRREVKVGVTTDWYTQITEGLQEGELVYVKE